jgi:hypothetical protein
LKDEKAIDWREGFQNFHWRRGKAQGKVMEAYQGREEYLVLGEGERRRMNV